MQIFNFFVATLGSAMSLILLVVVLIHYVYLDVKPELARDIPTLWVTAFLFGVIGCAGWLNAWARAAAHPQRTWFEMAGALVGGASIAILIQLFT